jgi:hypothetical protein
MGLDTEDLDQLPHAALAGFVPFAVRVATDEAMVANLSDGGVGLLHVRDDGRGVLCKC